MVCTTTAFSRGHTDLLTIQASLHFCSECNNLLYPKADQQRRIMVYACRICAYDEIGDNKCVYRNDLLTVTKYATSAHCCRFLTPACYREQVGVTTDLGSDPTLVSQRHALYLQTLLRLRPGPFRHPVPEMFTPGVCMHHISMCYQCDLTGFFSAVFYQDQSKRKETRMILFFVCTKCNHSFTDPTLPGDHKPELDS